MAERENEALILVLATEEDDFSGPVEDPRAAVPLAFASRPDNCGRPR
jgi:hypothetical protein